MKYIMINIIIIKKVGTSVWIINLKFTDFKYLKHKINRN